MGKLLRDATGLNRLIKLTHPEGFYVFLQPIGSKWDSSWRKHQVSLSSITQAALLS